MVAAINSRWDVLRELRSMGRKPAFPIFLTDSQQFLTNLESTGCFVIRHQAGMRLPAELLEGLDVRLHFFKCDMGGRVAKFVDGKGVKPKSLEVFCQCMGEYSVACAHCDDGSEPWAA